MKAKLLSLWNLLKQTAVDWSDHNAARLAAALAYYTVLSVAPLLVLAIAVVGLFFGEKAARGQVASELAGIVGPQAGEGIQTVIQHANSPAGGTIGSIISIVVLLLGASGVFGELQSALNTIWGVKPKPGMGVKGFLRTRFLSFTMVLGVAFQLLVSLLLSAALSAVGRYFSHTLPGGEVLWQALNFSISFGVITGLFALLFKVVPDVEIGWRDVWMGAVFTAFLFTIGKFALGLYLGRESVASPYGAAGSLIVLVIWVYYATQILFMGAEFTQVYARMHGSEIRPSAHAVALNDAAPEPARSQVRPPTAAARPL